MSLYSLFVISLGAFVVVHWWLLPKLELRLRVDRSAASIPLYASLAGLQFVRTVLLLSLLASILIVVAVGAATLSGGATAETLGAAVRRVQWLREAFSVFSPGWSLLLIALSVVALILLAPPRANEGRGRLQHTLRRGIRPCRRHDARRHG